MKFVQIIITLALLLVSSLCYSQYYNNDDDLRDFFSSILYLSDEALQTVKINGEQFEVLYRKPWTESIIEKKNLL